MGLCKCPKRKATNLFCFEHRVNVCEHCLVEAHDSCVVQTYLSWLTDSDYDPKCLLCAKPLASEETIRLKCLHNFHWVCLNNRIGHVPDGAPAGAYKCPSCLDNILPAHNETSPVIERLKAKLANVNWARASLGLEPRSGMETVTEASRPPVKQTFSVDMSFDSGHTENRQKTGRLKSTSNDQAQSLLANDTDRSDTKYVKRHTATRLRFARVPRYAKRIGLAILVLLLFYTILVMFGRDSSNNADPIFDPHMNPNIRVE